MPGKKTVTRLEEPGWEGADNSAVDLVVGFGVRGDGGGGVVVVGFGVRGDGGGGGGGGGVWG